MRHHGGHSPHTPMLNCFGFVGGLSQTVQMPHYHWVSPVMIDRVQGNANQPGAGINDAIEI